jgi:hypothetical protein
MNTFFSNLFHFVNYKEEWIRYGFLEAPNALSNSIILVFLKTVAEVVALALIFNLSQVLAVELLFVLGLALFFYNASWVFIKSSIVLLFQRPREEYHPQTQKIYMLYGFSYFPYLFLPAYCILVMSILYLFELSEIPIFMEISQAQALFLIVGYVACWVISALYRMSFYRLFKTHFYTDAFVLVLIPKLVELGLLFVIIVLLLAISTTSLIVILDMVRDWLPPELAGL